MLAIEVYRKQISPLRDEEKHLKGKLQRLQLSLIEREKSEEYKKLLRAVITHFDYLERDIDIADKKGLVRLVFKNIFIRNGRIKSFELFEPFKSFYERGSEFKWEMQEVQENQWVAKEEGSVSQLLPSAAK